MHGKRYIGDRLAAITRTFYHSHRVARTLRRRHGSFRNASERRSYDILSEHNNNFRRYVTGELQIASS